MKNISENTKQTVIKHLTFITRNFLKLATVAVILTTVSCSDGTQINQEMKIDSDLGKAVFAEPADAAKAFTAALEARDSEMFKKLLGAGYRELLSVDEVDEEDVDNYLKAWNKVNTLLPQGDDKMLIAIGEDQWTLPIPITQGASGWFFDVEEGRERTTIRRIGRNELSTMHAVLAYYDAQMEYAEQDRNGDGLLEYAQKFASTPGTHDGLFWEEEDGEMLSPLGPLMAEHLPGDAYFGYSYRILKAQGESARGGAYSYMLGSRMRAGFALIAWPEEYGDSGVMSFIVSHAGIVYEQNLGSDGAEIANAMTAFNPDEDWVPVKEVTDS